MIQSKAGWLCVECGHIEMLTDDDKNKVAAAIPAPPEVLGDPAPTPAVDSAPQPEAEPQPESESEPETTPESVPSQPVDVPAETPTAEVTPEVVVDTLADQPTAGPEQASETEKPSEPESTPELSTEPDPEPVVEPTPKPRIEAHTVHKRLRSHHKVHDKESKEASKKDEPKEETSVPVPVIDVASVVGDVKEPEPAIIEIAPAASPEKVLEESIAEIEKIAPADTEPVPEAAPADESPIVPPTESTPTADETSSPETAVEVPSEESTLTIPEVTEGPTPALVIDVSPPEVPASAPTAPETTPGPETTPDTEPALVPEPASTPEPTPEATPAPETSEVTPTLEPQTATASVADAQNAAPIADSAKPPLQPTTHPRPLSSGTIAKIAAASVVLLVLGGAVAYASVAKPAAMSWLTGLKATPAPSPSPTPTPAPVLGAEVTPTPAPAVPVNQNAQRIEAVAAYKAAYLATAVNGFFDTVPPAVAVSAVEPSTGKAYVVSKIVPTAIGQIRYWPGGVCSGPAKTPGTTGTKYLALQILLEGSTTPYCVEVK